MEWSVWGPCTRTCGQGGVQKRTAAAASTQYEFYQTFNLVANVWFLTEESIVEQRQKKT